MPHFLILDEMNLSHVERYFADLLSAIESGEEIPLYEGSERKVNGQVVPQKLAAAGQPVRHRHGQCGRDDLHVLAQRCSTAPMSSSSAWSQTRWPAFLAAPKAPRLDELDGKGASFGQGLREGGGGQNAGSACCGRKLTSRQEMLLFFNLLREHNAEFGYRTGYEAARFVHFYKLLGGYPDDDTDLVRATRWTLSSCRSFYPSCTARGRSWKACSGHWRGHAARNASNGMARILPPRLREAARAEDEGKYGPEVGVGDIEV